MTAAIPDDEEMSNGIKVRRWGRFNLVVMATIYLVFAGSMLLQPARWTRTPAYHNLFVVLPEHVWGIIYLSSGLLLVLAAVLYMRRVYWVIMTGIMCALMISVSWSFAFVVRVITSNNTTPETFMSFLAFSYLLVRVLMTIDHPTGRGIFKRR